MLACWIDVELVLVGLMWNMVLVLGDLKGG